MYQNLILMSVVKLRADKFSNHFSYNKKKRKEKFNPNRRNSVENKAILLSMHST